MQKTRIVGKITSEECEGQELNFDYLDEDQQEAAVDAPEIITIGDDESDGCKIDDETKSISCDVDGVIIKKMKDGSTIIVAGEQINLDDKLLKNIQEKLKKSVAKNVIDFKVKN